MSFSTFFKLIGGTAIVYTAGVLITKNKLNQPIEPAYEPERDRVATEMGVPPEAVDMAMTHLSTYVPYAWPIMAYMMLRLSPTEVRIQLLHNEFIGPLVTALQQNNQNDQNN